jgi:hypothetical protein
MYGLEDHSIVPLCAYSYTYNGRIVTYFPTFFIIVEKERPYGATLTTGEPSLEGCLERFQHVPHVGLGREVYPYDGPQLLLQCIIISLGLRRLERSE